MRSSSTGPTQISPVHSHTLVLFVMFKVVISLVSHGKRVALLRYHSK